MLNIFLKRVKVNVYHNFRCCSSFTPFYIVIQGKKPGVYINWEDCLMQVHKYKNCEYKKFYDRQSALAYLQKSAALLSNDSDGQSYNSNDRIQRMIQYCQNNFSENFIMDENPVVNFEKDLEPRNSRSRIKREKSVFRVEKDLICLEEFESSNNEILQSVIVDSLTNQDENFFQEPTANSGSSCSPEVNNFNMDADNRVIVYTDGSCIKNGMDNPSGGLGVYFEENNTFNSSVPLVGKQTSNRAELQASILGLQRSVEAGFCKVRMRTDSRYVVLGMSEWIEKWKQREWCKTLGGKPISNLDDWKQIFDLCKTIDVAWEKVKGHNDNAGNDAADGLAKEAANQGVESIRN